MTNNSFSSYKQKIIKSFLLVLSQDLSNGKLTQEQAIKLAKLLKDKLARCHNFRQLHIGLADLCLANPDITNYVSSEIEFLYREVKASIEDKIVAIAKSMQISKLYRLVIFLDDLLNSHDSNIK